MRGADRQQRPLDVEPRPQSRTLPLPPEVSRPGAQLCLLGEKRQQGLCALRARPFSRKAAAGVGVLLLAPPS